MGQCFSCNESSHSTQNGHTLSGATEVTHHGSQLSQHQQQHKTATIEPKPPSFQHAQDEYDRKIFAHYSKLAPVRQSSQTDPKRLSLTSKDYSESRINALFDTYKDPDSDLITEDGIVRFCQDLDVKPDDFRILALAWKFNADTMCKFSRSEFTNGCRNMKADSIKAIQAKFPDLLEEVKREATFKEFYRWTFRFALDSDVGQRSLPLEIARDLWKLVFYQHENKLLERWLVFLDENPCIRAISKDTWHMFLNFLQQMNNDLDSYDDTAAWPSLFDDFVQYERDRLNQNTQPSKEESD